MSIAAALPWNTPDSTTASGTTLGARGKVGGREEQNYRSVVL